MQSQSALLLALLCISSGHSLPTLSKLKQDSLVELSKAKNWVNENIVSKTRGDVTFNAPVSVGKLYGKVGNSKEGLFEETGFKKLLFDNDRGKLEGQIYQKTALKLLGLKGTNNVGAKLHWTKNSANVNVNLRKPIFGKNLIITVDGAGNIELKKDIEAFINKLDATFTVRKKSNAN